MRTCQSCGKENPADRDFCSCGEYLRWEPTGYMQAITPEAGRRGGRAGRAAQAARAAAPGAAAHVTPAPPPAPVAPGNGNGNGHAAVPPAPPAPPAPPPPTAVSLPAIVPPTTPAQQPPAAKTLVRGAVPASAQPSVPDASEPATIVLRLPEGDPAKGETLHQAVEPGQRERVLALIRNQSGIVDNYDLRVEGMPDDWWSIYPGTVYLVPFGAGGTYEQEVEIHLHPPRGPEAEARVWDLQHRRGLQGDAHGRGDGAAGAAHPAVHRDVDDAAPAAQEGPPQGDLRRQRRQPRQRAGARRARRRGPGRRAAVRLQPAAAGDPAPARR